MVNLIIGLLTRISVMIRYRNHINRRRVGLLLIGCVPGIFLGLVLRDHIHQLAVEIGAGILVLMSAVLISVISARRRQSEMQLESPRPWLFLLTGVTSGALGTTTSLNGVLPAALLTRCQLSSATFRGEMAMFLIVSNGIALAALTLRGLPPTLGWQSLLLWSLVAMVANCFGNVLSDRLPELVFRRIALLVIAASGCATVVSALSR